jgi:hypothetical protein
VPGRLVLDKTKIAAEERLDGTYLLSTSDPDLSAHPQPDDLPGGSGARSRRRLGRLQHGDVGRDVQRRPGDRLQLLGRQSGDHLPDDQTLRPRVDTATVVGPSARQ